MRRFPTEHLFYERIVGAKLGGEIGQRIRQTQGFVVVINRLARKKFEFQRIERAVAELGNPLPIGFGSFVHGTKQQPGIFKQISEERSGAAITNGYWPFLFKIVVHRRVLGDFGLRIFDPIVRAGARAQFGIARNCVTQFLFARLELCPDLRI